MSPLRKVLLSILLGVLVVAIAVDAAGSRPRRPKQRAGPPGKAPAPKNWAPRKLNRDPLKAKESAIFIGKSGFLNTEKWLCTYNCDYINKNRNKCSGIEKSVSADIQRANLQKLSQRIKAAQQHCANGKGSRPGTGPSKKGASRGNPGRPQGKNRPPKGRRPQQKGGRPQQKGPARGSRAKGGRGNAKGRSPSQKRSRKRGSRRRRPPQGSRRNPGSPSRLGNAQRGGRNPSRRRGSSKRAAGASQSRRRSG